VFIVSTTHFFHLLPSNKKKKARAIGEDVIPQKKNSTLVRKKKNRVDAFCGNDEGLIRFEALQRSLIFPHQLLSPAVPTRLLFTRESPNDNKHTHTHVEREEEDEIQYLT